MPSAPPRAKADAICAAAALQAKDDAIRAAVAMQAKAILAAAAAAPDSEGSRGRAPEARGRHRRATASARSEGPLRLPSPVLEADESQADTPP